jgi:hypothetical protein
MTVGTTPPSPILNADQRELVLAAITLILGSDLDFDEFAYNAQGLLETCPGLVIRSKRHLERLIKQLWKVYCARRPSPKGAA